MIRELDTVALTRDFDESGLKRGDVGAVAHCHDGGDAYEVEFVNAEGRTIAVLTLSGADVRPLGERDIPHVREMAAA